VWGSDTAVALWQAHRGWRGRRGLTPEEGWPGERYVLLVGVLVGDPAVAGAIEAHVHELMANGVLTRA
jgi:hypothetical protein